MHIGERGLQPLRGALRSNQLVTWIDASLEPCLMCIYESSQIFTKLDKSRFA